MIRTLAVACSMLPGLALASGRDEARIEAAVAGSSGRIAVNQAAGHGNAQANLAALAVAVPGGIGLASIDVRQAAQPGDRARDMAAAIGADAFVAARGLLSVNQAAGSGNAQANLFAVGQGALSAPLVGIDDATLAAVAGDAPPASNPDPIGLRTAEIADGAFRGGQGVVQVNQAAGVGNRSTNAIVLQLPGGAPH